MIVAVLADDLLKQELLAKKVADDITFVWADSVRALTITEADVYIDLLFEMDVERTNHLKRLLPKPVLVNAVAWPTKRIGAEFIRINAWPTLLHRSITEVVMPAGMQQEMVKSIFDNLQWMYRLVPDIPGMITARVIATIVNEAYHTLEAHVSSREEIDIAMKLGTSYPYGPFEWSAKIGLKNIYELLKELSPEDERYLPNSLMQREAVSNGQPFDFAQDSAD
jgi:3-hydroxybutyryl-CoA dehydrogenase